MTLVRCIQLLEGVRPWWWTLWPWAYCLALERCLLEVLHELEDERDTVVTVHYPK